MSDKYILDGKTAVPADLMTWAKWFEIVDRHVAQDEVAGHRVSTVFLGINHNFGDGPPLLFETMVFGADATNMWSDLCSTLDEAEAMHQRGIEYVRSTLAN